MNYPSINEYKEAILFAEDNFEQLKNLCMKRQVEKSDIKVTISLLF